MFGAFYVCLEEKLGSGEMRQFTFSDLCKNLVGVVTRRLIIRYVE